MLVRRMFLLFKKKYMGKKLQFIMHYRMELYTKS